MSDGTSAEDCVVAGGVAGSEATLEIEKVGNNLRMVRSQIRTKASLDAVWAVLTSYEKLADLVPDMVACEVVDRWHNGARVSEVVQKTLPMGMKMSMKMVRDFDEKELETAADGGKKRELHFQKVNGDFEVYQGKWCIHQSPAGEEEEEGPEDSTLITFSVTVKPKNTWVPFSLVEPKIRNDTVQNMTAVKKAALRLMNEGGFK